MTPVGSISMLYARVQLVHPDARSILLASPRSSGDLGALAQEIASSASHVGRESTVIKLKTPLESEFSSTTSPVPASQFRLAQLREALSSSQSFAIVVGAGILDDSATLLAVPLVSGVVLVARRGHTSRADVERAAAEVRRAGGAVFGAVLRR